MFICNCLWRVAQLYQPRFLLGKRETSSPLTCSCHLPAQGQRQGLRSDLLNHHPFAVNMPGEHFCCRIKIQLLSSLADKWDNASELVEQGFMVGSFPSLMSTLTFGPLSVLALGHLSLLPFESFWVGVLTWTGKTFPSTITEYVLFSGRGGV